MKKTRTAYLHSVLALLVCISMFVGSTFAWFTDNVSSVNNIIKSGNLDLEMYWTDDLATGTWYNVEDPQYNTVFNYDNWEPGYTDVKYIKLVNKGSLALNFELTLTPSGSVGKLAEVISVYYGTDGVALAQRSDLDNLNSIGLLSNVMNGGATAKGSLLAKNEESPLHDSSETIITLAMSMLTTAGNEYQNESVGDGFTITALASQCAYEADSFGTDYDKDASFPKVLNSSKAEVELEDGKIPTGGLTISGGGVSAVLPEDVKLEDGVQKLTVTVTPLEKTTSDITVVNQEILIPVDVHIEGVAEDNTAPIIIDLGEILPKYLNMGNYHLYHVEDGVNNEMSMVDSVAALTAHNQFTYDSDTGAVTVAMATFSEVALVADTANKWNGDIDDSWYTKDPNATEFVIYNADQLYAFAKIVGGMADGIEADSFNGDTITLLSDINLNYGTVINHDGAGNGPEKKIFYPVGYYNNDDKANYDDKTGIAISSGFKNFEGTFDGNGHTISNIYQNTWEMKGDHDWYAPEDQHYRDGMGLFGRVYGGTIKNLSVHDFTSDGEITTTGVIAAYADFGATFENIAITNCNPRVYNIGNGGIVGCVGWYTKGTTDKKVTFKNITVDSTNKISALWGSYDVACGGIVGQYYPTSGQTSAGTPKNPGIHFENCHVSAVMDVYNDVCANYQYYAYRYAGMMIGSIRENVTQNGRVYPKMDGITASGCTVHYETWNDYYYCELVANSLASYTHDHQFSRLEEVAGVNGNVVTYLNGTKKTIEAGTYNFVVRGPGEFSTENATCYHFVDGQPYSHDSRGKETVNGVEIDVEDHRHIYLPFNQLFTGYGWGVTSKGIEDFDGIDTMDITSSDQKDSVEKFKKADAAKETYTTDEIINIGDLFTASGAGTIQSENVQVYVSPVDDESTASGIYAADTSDWTKGTLTFSGVGAATITITDYYFCTPTTINVEIVEYQPEPVVKFTSDQDGATFDEGTTISVGELFSAADGAEIVSDAVQVTLTPADGSTAAATYTADSSDWTKGTLTFGGNGAATITITDDNLCTPTTINVTVKERVPVKKFETKFTSTAFTYRVGNQNSVALGSLFEAVTDVTIGNVSVAFETVSGTAAGAYTANASDWTKATIQFSGNGRIKVTVQDDDYCIPTEITLEVVTATNVTGATNATDKDVVLLKDGGFGSLEVSGGHTLYGNGFTLTCGSDSAALDFGYSFVTLNNGTLDNVQVICPNFDYAALYKSNLTSDENRSETTDKTRYFNAKSGVIASGNSQILNSRISGGRAAVNVSGGNVVIDNSRIELGAVASILVGAANSLTLRNVTLVQKPAASTHDSNKSLMGFSVLYVCDAEGKATSTTLEGKLIQNAWVNSDHTQYVPSDGQSIVDAALTKTDYLHDIDGDGINESLNLGFAYMPESSSSTNVNTPTNIVDNRENKSSVPYEHVEVKPNIFTTLYIYSYKNTGGTDGEIKNEAGYEPNKYSDIVEVSYTDTTDGLTPGKSYDTSGWIYELGVDLDKLSGYAIDFSQLTMSVNGVTYTDYMVDGNAKPSSAAVETGGKTYVLTKTIDGKTYTANWKVTGTETSKDSPSLVTKNYADGFGVANSYGGDWSAAAPVLSGVTIKYWSVAEKKYVELPLSSIPIPKNGKLNEANNYWEYEPDNKDYKLKITNSVAIHSGKSVFGIPIGRQDANEVYFTISGTSGFVGSGTTSRAITIHYEFTDNNGGTKLEFDHTWNIAYNKDEQYNYNTLVSDGTMTKLQAGSGGGGCVTPDSLITLADGSKKAVSELDGSEELLVWNLETGKLDSAPIMFVDNDPQGLWEVIQLYFSDGTKVDVISEHGFWDYDLNRYVYLDCNASKYIGHTFAKQDGEKLSKVKLVKVVLQDQVTTPWSPVTVEHLCYFVNDMLTMPGGVAGLMNIFDVDAETMSYDFAAMARDIATYGLFTYEELSQYVELTEEMFYAAGGPYLKISIAKGNMTMEELVAMIERYKKYI
ncbi:MAG: hypothetical protein IJC88_00270 [Oscillospiraceae bacterium]|nr:hypothetical protein [Oscillospiraceae bacterium]